MNRDIMFSFIIVIVIIIGQDVKDAEIAQCFLIGRKLNGKIYDFVTSQNLTTFLLNIQNKNIQENNERHYGFIMNNAHLTFT